MLSLPDLQLEIAETEDSLSERSGALSFDRAVIRKPGTVFDKPIGEQSMTQHNTTNRRASCEAKAEVDTARQDWNVPVEHLNVVPVISLPEYRQPALG